MTVEQTKAKIKKLKKILALEEELEQYKPPCDENVWKFSQAFQNKVAEGRIKSYGWFTGDIRFKTTENNRCEVYLYQKGEKVAWITRTYYAGDTLTFPKVKFRFQLNEGVR